MLRTAVVLSTLAALAGGCQKDKNPPAWDKNRPAPTSARADQPATGTPAPTGSIEERLARVERKLDKVTGFLKQAVRPELDTSATYAVPIDPADPVSGPADAKVTIVEAYEFMCPYCAMIAPTVDQLLSEYPKDVRVVSKYFLIHGPPAMPAGQAACAAARQGKYHEFKNVIWKKAWPNANQPPDRDQLTPDALAATAGEVGLDLARFKTDMDGDCKDWVGRSGRTLQHFGAGGTPSFYINGRFTGANDLAGFKKIIDEEIQKADEAIRGGVKASDYYDKVVIGKGEKQAIMISPFDD